LVLAYTYWQLGKSAKIQYEQITHLQRVQPYSHLYQPNVFVKYSQTHLGCHFTCDTDCSLVQNYFHFYNAKARIANMCGAEKSHMRMERILNPDAIECLKDKKDPISTFCLILMKTLKSDLAGVQS
jgi:hypothetical protein